MRLWIKLLNEIRWSAVNPAARAACVRLAAALPPPRVIYDREGGSPYLSRWYLTGSGLSPDVGGVLGREQVFRAPGPLARISRQTFLHRFHRSDDDGALHSHPWEWAVSIVLAGGYIEERRVGDRVVSRVLPPGSINVIRAEDFHRVDLIESDAWSIFFCGPKAQSWAFWDRDLKASMPWREFIARRRGNRLPCGVSNVWGDTSCVRPKGHPSFHLNRDQMYWEDCDAELAAVGQSPDSMGAGWIPDRREP